LKIAVVQHRLRATPAEDADALIAAANQAVDQGAELLFLPEVPSLQEAVSVERSRLYSEIESLPARLFVPQLGVARSGFVGHFEPSEALHEIGSMALLIGDGCIDMDAIAPLVECAPDVCVFVPRSESELQAEAMLEVAVALSDSLAGLVVVTEPDGAEPGEPGHGGSAIIMFGKVVAEAIGGDDLLLADVETPLGPPTPREPLPQVPTILLQRLAHHEGRHLEVDYPADLSEGPGPR